MEKQRLKTVIPMRECGKMDKWMGMEFIFGAMVHNMKGNLWTAIRMVKENIKIQMGIFSKEFGKMGKETEKGN